MANAKVIVAAMLTLVAFFTGYRAGISTAPLPQSCEGNKNFDLVYHHGRDSGMFRGSISNRYKAAPEGVTSFSKPCPVRNTTVNQEGGVARIRRKEGGSSCAVMKGHEENTFLHKVPTEDSVLTDVFSYLHHPSCPSRGELVLTYTNKFEQKSNFSSCSSVYMLRAAVRTDQPNKCLAVARTQNMFDDDDNNASGGNSAVEEAGTREKKRHGDGAPWNIRALSHRTGSIDWPQVLSDQYQEDWIHSYSFRLFYKQTKILLADHAELLQLFKDTVGEPIDANGNRRTSIIMVANEGGLDLVLNFMCSGVSAGIDLSAFVVFVAQEEYIDLVNAIGAKAIYHPSLGDMPREHSKSYADRIFAKIMWLKVTSVYIALKAGYHVLFQDADLVWLRDPVPYLVANDAYDILFMDDGARTPRFAPFFTNTGFYFVRHNAKNEYFLERLTRAVGEIDFTSSHQATFIRYLTECHYLFGLRFLILDEHLFPAGRQFHEEPLFVSDVVNHRQFPFVWHMCWTPSRENKGKFLEGLGLWFLKPKTSHGGMCEDVPKALKWVKSHRSKVASLVSLCCKKGGYWNWKPGQAEIRVDRKALIGNAEE